MRRVIPITLSMLTAVLCGQSLAAEDAAHAIAQKFAAESPKQTPAKPAVTAKPAAAQVPAAGASKRDENEMLEAARAEAATRKASPPAAVPSQHAAAEPKQAATQPAATPSPEKPSAAANGPVKATVLVVLTQSAEAGSMPKTFDPIICLGSNCYVSNGANAEARAIAKDAALTTKNAVTTGAGDCAGKTSCAFRGVPIEPSAGLQIIDLGLVRHDHHELMDAKIDPTCLLDEGDLICTNPVTSPDYRVWIVPETVANQAGAEKLAAALAAELPEENLMLESDK